MGAITLRFTARAETDGKSPDNDNRGWGISYNIGGGHNNNLCTRHAPLAFYKGENCLGILLGFNSRVASDTAATFWAVPTVGFADYGYSSNFQSSGQVIETDTPDRFTITVNNTAGAQQCKILPADYSTGDVVNSAAGSNTLVADNVSGTINTNDWKVSRLDCCEGGGNLYNADKGFTHLVAGTEYDMIIEGDFDRVDIVDWRAFQHGIQQYGVTGNVVGDNGLLPGIRSGRTYPELFTLDYLFSTDADFDDLVGNARNYGVPGEGVAPVDETTNDGYYTRIYKTLKEDATDDVVDSSFEDASGNAIGDGWEVFSQNSKGIDPERFIYVNGNVAATGTQFRDGTSEMSAYQFITDIPAGELTQNALVYAVAGSVVGGETLSVDTIFAVNDGAVETGGGGTGGGSGVQSQVHW